MSNERSFDAFKEELNAAPSEPKLVKKIYPWEWECQAQSSTDYWRRICEEYLVRIFDPAVVFLRSARRSDYSFMSNEMNYFGKSKLHEQKQ